MMGLMDLMLYFFSSGLCGYFDLSFLIVVVVVVNFI